MVNLIDFNNGEEIANILKFPVNEEIYLANWVNVKGALFKDGCYLCVGYDEVKELPIFAHVLNFFVKDNYIVKSF